MFKLETKKLILKDFERKDLLGYIELRNDDKFKRFYNESDVTDERSASLLEEFMSRSKEAHRTMFQFAVTTTDGVLIGSCGIRVENRYFQGRWWNTVIFGLLKREWINNSASNNS